MFEGHDTVDGGTQNDTLEGNAGNDSLVGGSDTDFLLETGGSFTLSDTPDLAWWGNLTELDRWIQATTW